MNMKKNKAVLSVVDVFNGIVDFTNRIPGIKDKHKQSYKICHRQKHSKIDKMLIPVVYIERTLKYHVTEVS